MKPQMLCLILAVPFAAAADASAQAKMSDAQYCQALIRLYRTYVYDPNDARPKRAADAARETAIAKCQAGNTAGGIPPLEKALRDAKVNLPQRG
jgi:hypothetical protein